MGEGPTHVTSRRISSIPIRSIRPLSTHANAFEGFKIRSLSEVLAGSDINHDLHRHDFYFLLIISRGEGLHEIDFVPFHIANHAVFILRPGQVHRLHMKAGSEGYLIEFSKGFEFLSANQGNELLRKAGRRNFCKLDEAAFESLIPSLQAIFDEYQSRPEGFATVIRAHLEILLTRLLRYRQHPEAQSTMNNAYQQEKLEAFLALLENNVTTIRQVAAYAEMMSLSTYQLNSITKNLLGKTVAQLIEDQVLLEAKRHLLATSDQVNQIAFRLGFEDVSYFIRFFRKLTGHTPEAFRKNFS